VTSRPTIALETIVVTCVYGPRLARDITAPTGIAVSTEALERRKITPKRRWRLARDIATALSHDSSIFSIMSAGLGEEAGA
jgi:hypothetical protein